MDESIVKELEQVTLKPSAALRIGIALRPRQAFMTWFDKDNGSCAMGAMYQGMFGSVSRPERGWASRLHQHNPKMTVDLISRIMNMNDSYGSTREQIADWLEAQGL